MTNAANSKVAVDSTINETVPTVILSKKPKEVRTKDPEENKNVLAQMAKYTVNFFMDFLETIVVALSIFVIIYLFLVQPHEVKGGSMEPTFHNNEYILTDKISFRFQTPRRGDVVIFKAPRNPELDYIKRIIGLPGEQVRIEKGHIYINDTLLTEPYIDSPSIIFPGGYMQEGVALTIPQEEYFVMGDNRQHSSDSREFGPVKRNTIIGRAFIRYWPLAVFGPVSAITY